MRIWNWVWCLGLAVGFHSCSEVMDEEVVSPDRHLIDGTRQGALWRCVFRGVL